jgi:predicted AlkP superfamily phosphohydrolase/phosphomutase
MSRTVVLCLDGGDPTVIGELIAAGRLPALGALADRGSRVRVADTLGRIMDLSVWTPILSGRPAGDHAVAHFEEFDPETMGTIFRREGVLEPLWSHLPARGAGAVVLDPPEMHVFPGSAAAQSCGWHSHAPVHPPVITDAALAARLAARGRPPALLNTTRFGPEVEERAVRHLIASAAFRRETIEAVGLDRDFTLLGIHELHTAVHALGHHGPRPHWLAPERRDPELLARVYVAVDEVVGTVVRLAGADANVVLLATRGIRPADHAGHLLEGLLERAGLLVRRAETGADSAASDRGARAAEMLRGLVPGELRERVATRVLPERWQQRLAARRFRDHFAWERTRAFPCPTWSSGLIRLNVQGREARGIVPPGEVEPLLGQIERLLAEVQDADTGLPLIEEVIRPAERFPGELAHRWPDLVLTWAGGRPARAARHPRLGTWTAIDSTPVWTEHGTELEVTLAGPGIRAGVSIDSVAAGFVPTVLALAAARMPTGLPGHPWADVLAA